MYQAIVFLPLLGFILAAAISLVGARARFPGAEPSDDDHHHAPAHVAHAAHDTHAHAPPPITTITTRPPSPRRPAPAPPKSSPRRC